MKYECETCGYVYDPAVGDPDNGIAPGTAWEDIPGAFEKNYTVTATEYNCKDFWRAKVTSVSNE